MFRVRHLAMSLMVLAAATFAAPSFDIRMGGQLTFGPSMAEAQRVQVKKKKKRRSLFSILFGRKKTKKKKAAEKAEQSKRTKKVRTASKKKKVKKVPSKPVVPKRPDAKVILVLGDFFAGSLADGLKASLSDVATLRVVDESKDLSGFVRDDIVNWSAKLPVLIEDMKPSYVVVMLGANDRRAIKLDETQLKKGSPEWFTTYGERVDRLASSLKAMGVRYSWVGLPPVRRKNMSKDYLKLNEIFGKAAGSETGKFVDIWDGYSDADGNYSRSGPDVSGQIVLLRRKDGINLSRAGRERLAYYVEGPIVKLLGGREDKQGKAVALGIGTEAFTIKSPAYNPQISGKTFVIRLNDPSTDGGEALAGEKVDFAKGGNPAPKPSLESSSLQTLHKQQRVNNFSWPPPIPVAAVKKAAAGSKSKVEASASGRALTATN